MKQQIKEINDLVRENAQFDQLQPFEFCCKYLAVQRTINKLNQSPLLADKAGAIGAKKFLLSDNLEYFGIYPENRLIFLKKLMSCKGQLLNYQAEGIPDYQEELAQICKEHIEYLLLKQQYSVEELKSICDAHRDYIRLGSQRKYSDNELDDIRKNDLKYLNPRVLYYPEVFTILLFAPLMKAREYFFAMSDKVGESFLLALIKRNCCGALDLLLRLSDGAPSAEQSTLLLYLSRALGQAEKYIPATQMLPYWVSYCKVYIAAPKNKTMDVDTNRLIHCLLEPGVIEQAGQASIMKFLKEGDDRARRDVLMQLPSIAKVWFAENSVSENTRIAYQAIQATVDRLSNYCKNLPHQSLALSSDGVDFTESTDSVHVEPGVVSTDYPRLVVGLISVLSVKKPKPSTWARFLIWLGWNAPTPTQFSAVQIQQLICCAPANAAESLLRHHYPKLTASDFLALINNPVLCADNRRLLVERFFEKEQSALRAEVYRQLEQSGKKIPLVVVQEWLSPLSVQSEKIRFLKCAFDDEHFQAGCEKLELSELLSLNEIYMNHNVTGLPIATLTWLIEKATQQSISSNVELDNLMPYSPAGQQDPESAKNPALFAFLRYIFFTAKKENSLGSPYQTRGHSSGPVSGVPFFPEVPPIALQKAHSADSTLAGSPGSTPFGLTPAASMDSVHASMPVAVIIPDIDAPASASCLFAKMQGDGSMLSCESVFSNDNDVELSELSISELVISPPYAEPFLA